MSALDGSSGPTVDAVQCLVGASICELEPIGKGGNSRVYRVRSGDLIFALKQYPSPQDNSHDRFATEVDALELMKGQGIEAVPDVIAVDRDRGFALLSWIDGSPVTEVSAADIDQAVAFLTAVHTMGHTSAFPPQRLAAEACLSGAEIARQICVRLKRLQQLPAEEEDLHAFLHVSFRPAFNRLTAQTRERMRAAGLDFSAALPQDTRSLVPSDCGFHNSLRRPNGRLAFFDFEYFGWDDPVKLTADFLLHPGTQILLPQRQRFRRAAECIYRRDPTFRPRLDALYPLFGLRWALIVLNEFLPDRWRRRVMAGAADNWTVAKRSQLARARDYVTCSVAEEH